MTSFEGLSPLSRLKTLADVGGPLKLGEGVETASFDRSANTEDTLRSVTYLIFDRLHSLILN